MSAASMFVHFSSPKSADFFLLERDAKPIFELMGKHLSTQGVIAAENAASVLATLNEGLAQHAALNKPPSVDEVKHDDDQDPADAPPPVGLKQRAWPLREMLADSVKQGGDIMWECSAS